MRRVRVLPSLVYDALHFSCLAFGGIGSAYFYARSKGVNVPLCILGHSYACDPSAHLDVDLRASRITGATNDEAVGRINRRRGRAETARVSWGAWTRELDVVRGE